ncbi:MAG: protoglobin domain-containing protein [Myxococcota bacterium]
MTYQAEFAQMKTFLHFTEADVSRLQQLAPVFHEHAATITDAFYARLAEDSETAPIIGGRVEALKRTHKAWMVRLFAGEYDDAFLDEQVRIGRVHVRAGILPRFVELIGSVLRQDGIALINHHFDDQEMIDSYIKVLDLTLSAISYAYLDERLARMSRISGMSRTLIERLIARG